MIPAHTKEDFELFMSQLKETNATLAFYSDFKKIAKNVDDIAISLNMLNFLLGKDNLQEAVEALIWLTMCLVSKQDLIQMHAKIGVENLQRN